MQFISTDLFPPSHPNSLFINSSYRNVSIHKVLFVSLPKELYQQKWKPCNLLELVPLNQKFLGTIRNYKSDLRYGRIDGFCSGKMFNKNYISRVAKHHYNRKKQGINFCNRISDGLPSLKSI